MNMAIGQHQVEMQHEQNQGVYLEGDGFDEDDYGEDGESE